MELAAPQNQIKISILYVKHILNHIRAALGTWVKHYSAMFVLTIRLHQPPTRIKYPAPSLIARANGQLTGKNILIRLYHRNHTRVIKLNKFIKYEYKLELTW